MRTSRIIQRMVLPQPAHRPYTKDRQLARGPCHLSFGRPATGIMTPRRAVSGV